MIITREYLEGRHRFWRQRIGEAGIWDPDRFEPVELTVRKKSVSYAGLFQRRYAIRNGKRIMHDRIVIYQQDGEIPSEEIDNTLVHEMIHQYIFQNELKDARSHGPVFRGFMQAINARFAGELLITISGKRESSSGPGMKLHLLLLLWTNSGECYCCKIMPSKVGYFMNLVEKSKDTLDLRQYMLCESRDRYFESMRACRTRLHGSRHTEQSLRDLCVRCRIRPIE